MGWCDDTKVNFYNKQIKLPSKLVMKNFIEKIIFTTLLVL
jgi:hypothetical protein